MLLAECVVITGGVPCLFEYCMLTHSHSEQGSAIVDTTVQFRVVQQARHYSSMELLALCTQVGSRLID